MAIMLTIHLKIVRLSYRIYNNVLILILGFIENIGGIL